jgi:hypothetical protein
MQEGGGSFQHRILALPLSTFLQPHQGRDLYIEIESRQRSKFVILVSVDAQNALAVLTRVSVVETRRGH